MLPHGDDLTLETHLHPVKRHHRSARELDVQTGAIRPSADVVQNAFDTIARTGDRAIDALDSNKQRALDTLLSAQFVKRLAQPLAIRELRKAVQRRDTDRLRGVVDRHGHGRPIAHLIERLANQRRFFDVLAVNWNPASPPSLPICARSLGQKRIDVEDGLGAELIVMRAQSASELRAIAGR